MTDPAMELKAAAARLAAGRGAGPHLTEDEIAAYHAGTLPPDQEARAQDHLLACSECTQLLLGLEELAGEGEPVPDGEVAAAWQQMRALLPLPAAEPAASPPAPLPFPSRRTAVPPWFGALAASLLVAVVGLSIYAASLRQTISEQNRPQANTPVFDLSSDPFRGVQEQVLELPAGVQSFVLVLSTSDARIFPRYELEIARADGTVVGKSSTLNRNKFGSFTLTLHRSLVDEGEYHLRLWGQGKKGREALGEYPLRIVSKIKPV